jgi:3-oxoacyl-[acyl-carrier-protein] synthase-1
MDRSSSDLRVVSAGICCALGHELATAGPAIAANLDAFGTAGFLTDTGVPIPVAALPSGRIWGVSRLAQWAAWAIRDCLASAYPGLTQEALIGVARSCALLLLTPTAEALEDRDIAVDGLPEAVASLLGLHFSNASRVLPFGEAGMSRVLDQAAALLEHAPEGRVLLVSADSLLDVQLIERMVEDERLRVPGSDRDGFTPGEAAAAVLLESASRPRSGGLVGQADFRLLGWGAAEEAARWNNGLPNRSQGLTTAVRAALGAAHVTMADVDYRLSDQNGETFLVRDAANAMTRLMADVDRYRSPVLITLADKIGDVGVSVAVVGLALLHYFSAHPVFCPGRVGLIHLAQDDGLRCALVVGTRPMAA